MRTLAAIAVANLALAGAARSRAAEPAGGASMPSFVPAGMIGAHLYDGTLSGPAAVHFAGGEIYVADSGNRLVGIFDGRGYPIFAFGGPGVLEDPRKVVVDREGRIVVLDGHERLRVFSYRGVPLRDLELPGLGDRSGRTNVATIALAPGGELVAAAEETQEVLVYDLGSGRIRARFGGRGLGPGRFSAIAAIVADADGFWVLDQVGLAVQAFDGKGRYLRGWGQHDVGPADFSLPAALAVDPRGWVLAADAVRGEIKVFDRTGRFLGRAGSFGTGPGQLAFPSDMAVDAEGRLLVAEKGTDRVQILRVEERHAPASPPRGEEGGGRGPPNQGPQHDDTKEARQQDPK